MKTRRESDPLYWLLWLFFRLAFRIFFSQIQVRHSERIPRRGPVIFACNHPNDLIDPLLIGSVSPRRIDFVAKNTLFGFGPLGPVFRRFGVIPVYRREDAEPEGPEQFMKKNDSMFAASSAILAEGGAIAMFPEGVSHRDPEVKRLKTGTARIALQTEADRDFRLGTTILPVGLTFSRWNRFQGEVLIRIGRPIPVRPYQSAYATAPEEAVRSLTAEIEKALRALTLHTQEAQLARLAREIREMFHGKIVIPKELSSPLYQEREILEALHFFQKTDSKWFLGFGERLERYRNRLLGLGLRDRVVAKKTSAVFPLALLSKEIFLGLIGIPFALFGAVNNYLPYRLPTLIADRMKKVDAEATVKFLSGVILFPLFYIGQVLGVELLFGIKIALVYLAALPPTGLFSFYYWIWLRRTRTSFYLALLHVTRRGILQELRLEREGLIGEIEKMQEIFIRVRRGGASQLEPSLNPTLDKVTGEATGPIARTA